MNHYFDVLRKYAVFEGRARRREYWMFMLLNTIVSLVLSVIGSFIVGLYALAVLIPGIAVGVRRLHDTGRSGWWLLIGLVPLVGIIVLLVFLVQDSQLVENRYGPYPKAASAWLATP